MSIEGDMTVSALLMTHVKSRTDSSSTSLLCLERSDCVTCFIWPQGGATVTLPADPSADIKQDINSFYPFFTALNQLVSPSLYLGPAVSTPPKALLMLSRSFAER